jgi:hypothetical protein
MPNCTEETGICKIEFGRLGRRVVEGRFDGGSMSSDAGVMLLKLAAVVTRNTRRIRLYLASNWPSANIFAHVMCQLRSP